MNQKPLTEQYILEEIGQGSQGKLYKATDKANSTVLAMKRLQLKKATAIDDVHRLEDAARALEQISHPNVVGYRGTATREDDCGSPEFWLSMEYVDGTSLAHVVRDGKRLTEEELYAIAEQTLEGLAATHARGIVHRDVKPSNILQSEDGTIKLTDFGIAKFLGEETRGSSIIGKGTTEYMAPEQFDPKLPITPATDYYGLGMTLLELATGRERRGAYFHENPTEDIATLRKSGHLSKKFVDDLELLVDTNPEKRKEGVRRMRETTVVYPVESVEDVVADSGAESIGGNIENRVGGETYGGLVKWKKVFSLDEIGKGYITGYFSGVFLGLFSAIFSGESVIQSVQYGMISGAFTGTGVGGCGVKIINWNRRRKAEKAAGVETIEYDLEQRMGTKDDSLEGIEFENQHYVLDTDAMHVYHYVPSSLPRPSLRRTYQIICYDEKKKKAKVIEVADKKMCEEIYAQYDHQRKKEEQEFEGAARQLEDFGRMIRTEKIPDRTVEQESSALAEK